MSEHYTYDGPAPFTRPEGSDASMFIQWKGTTVCMDFQCDICGTNGHIDDSFVYHVECPGCGSVYEMGTQVIATRLSTDTALGIKQRYNKPKVLDA